MSVADRWKQGGVEVDRKLTSVFNPINPDFAALVLPAVESMKRLVLDPTLDLRYATRREVPEFSVNDYGWPSISTAHRGASLNSPVNWDSLFGTRKGNGSTKFDLSDTPELRDAIDFVLGDFDLREKLNGFGVEMDDSDTTRTLTSLDVIRFSAAIGERAVAVGRDVAEVYLEHERAFLAPSLVADVMIPLCLVTLDLKTPMHLGGDVWLEPLDEATQRSRAVDINNEVNAYLVSAATHAVVLRDRVLGNEDGPLARRVRIHSYSYLEEEIEQVLQAVDIACEQRVGYVQVVLRPHDWADKWLGDLPPIQSAKTLSRLPTELSQHGWNRPPKLISASSLESLPETLDHLQKTHQRGKLASRRLFQSGLRSMPEDVLLDACIGIEALLGEQHDELVHRMGLRAATALAPRSMEAALAYDLLKKVYNHRSKIVHGAETTNPTIAIGDDKYSAKSVAVLLLRVLLRSHLAKSPSWTPSDLDTQLFGALNRESQARASDSADA